MTRQTPTPEITLGPFFPPRYVDPGANDLTLFEGRSAKGEAIEIYGNAVQEDGTPMHNLVLEIWQADANGIFGHPADPRCREADPDFFGWGRAATGKDGRYDFRTIRPGACAGPDGRLRAPHINLIVLFSGVMRQLNTAIFFEGEAGNATDPVLSAVPAARRGLLTARRESATRYRFDLRLRGEGETPFFDI